MVRERFLQFREIQSNLSRINSEKRSFKQKAAQCQQAAVTRVQEVVTGVQESETLAQETALAQELRKLAEEATARAQEAERLANILQAEVQQAEELAAYFEGKVVYFRNKDEAKAIADLKRDYRITVHGRSSFHLKPGADRVELQEFARRLGIM